MTDSREKFCVRACEGIGTGELAAILEEGSSLKERFATQVGHVQEASITVLKTRRVLEIIRHGISNECCGALMDKVAIASSIDEFLATTSIPHMRRVVCAANRYGEGLLLLGARHWDKQMHAMADKIGFNRADYEREEQGFIDQYGVFLTRAEAWVVAKAAGQIIRRCGGDEGCLYSENLY